MSLGLKVREIQASNTGGKRTWKSKEKRDGERVAREVCRGAGTESTTPPAGYHSVPAVHSAIDTAHKNEIRTFPQLSASH